MKNMDHPRYPTGEFERDYLAWYDRNFRNPGRPFDPTLLVALAREQWTDRPELAASFARCTREWPRNQLYSYFMSPMERPTKWRFATNLFLAHPTLGTLLVDVMTDQSIGGIEYLDRVMERHISVAEWKATGLRSIAHATAKLNTN